MSDPPIKSDRAPQTLAFLLSQVGIHASKRFAERIAAVGINPPLFRVLNLVDAAEGQSQQAIGAAIEVPASRMVALVDELEQRGLVERRPEPKDRRVRALFLTAKGRKTLARGREIAKRHEEELTQGMPAADRKRLVTLLQSIVDQQAIGPGVHPGLSEKPQEIS
ncbi:MAG TPA: MarR family winged helix-turn-helix transcriptional regulator [Solirubrobacterales bacterium]|jgi:DNA-binding MarR family transcriptional regulator|nr:MarR family winged helix-turn-helix transcriptional regulator [Solirubrobacterales bacterium]